MMYAEYDIVKSSAVLRTEIGKICAVPGCTEHITQMQGPGSSVLCRNHQLYMREYGGMGRIDRPWTFHRKKHCLECGFSPFEDSKNKHYHLRDTDPDLWNRLCRNKLIGDEEAQLVAFYKSLNNYMNRIEFPLGDGQKE